MPVIEPEPVQELVPEPVYVRPEPVVEAPPPPPPAPLSPEELAELPAPSKILRGLKNEQVNEGETIVLKALIFGNPFPRVLILLLK